MGEIAPEEQFLPLSTIFYYLMLDFYVKIGIRFSLRDKRLFGITEVEITRVDCMHYDGAFSYNSKRFLFFSRRVPNAPPPPLKKNVKILHPPPPPRTHTHVIRPWIDLNRTFLMTLNALSDPKRPDTNKEVYGRHTIISCSETKYKVLKY